MNMRVVCSWCLRVLVEGDPSQLTSHGCCPACIHKMLGDPALSIPEAERRLEEAQRSR